MDGGGFHLALQNTGQVIGAGHSNVHAQAAQHLGVFGVVDTGYGLFHMEDPFGNLAGDQIHLVPAGYCHQSLAAAAARGLQIFHGGAVALGHRDVQVIGHLVAQLAVLFDHDGLVAVVKQGLCHVVAHLAAADDHYSHN